MTGPAEAQRTGLRFEDVEVGAALPELVVELTPTRIVAGAIASHDFQDVHHDTGAAKSRGLPDIFMNILTTNGYVSRFVTDWAGPDVFLRKVSIRLGVPNVAGDSMRMTGSVTSAEVVDGEGVLGVEVKGTNGKGEHVTAEVSLVLPRRS